MSPICGQVFFGRITCFEPHAYRICCGVYTGLETLTTQAVSVSLGFVHGVGHGSHRNRIELGGRLHCPSFDMSLGSPMRSRPEAQAHRSSRTSNIYRVQRCFVVVRNRPCLEREATQMPHSVPCHYGSSAFDASCGMQFPSLCMVAGALSETTRVHCLSAGVRRPSYLNMYLFDSTPPQVRLQMATLRASSRLRAARPQTGV